MRYNNYDNSGSSFLTRVVKKSDIEKTLLLNREIDDWKSNDKKKAYKERGRVYASCSFIEVSFSQIRAVDVEKKIENAEQLRDLTRNIVKNKTSSLHEITPSKNRVTSACNSERRTTSQEANNLEGYHSCAQGTSRSASITKKYSKKTTSRPKREKRQTILPNGEIKECSKCKDPWTIQWRSGPDQNRELCSPCGLAYGKRLKKENEKKRQAADKRIDRNNP